MKSILSLLIVLGLAGGAWAAEGGANQPGGIPPAEAGAKAAIEKSPRHGEWVKIPVPGGPTPINSYVVYPERKDKAPVVIVIHEIFGESDWIRAVADQLAADGFIAIAPDLLSGKGANGGGSETFERSRVMGAVSALNPDEVIKDLNAVRDYGLHLPSATDKVASIGFCWGGGKSFAFAAAQPDLSAAVVYYGTPPSDSGLDQIKAPVLGLYGGNDNRVTSTVEPTKGKMKERGKSYDPHIFPGAGHGFLRAQDGQNGANAKAAQEAWPLTITFLREHTK